MGHSLRELPPSGHGRARGLVSSRRSGSRVEARVYAPPADLTDVVESFWMGRWDLRGQEPHVTELLGDPCVHIVAERGCGRVVGVWTHRWTRTLEGRGLVRGVKLRAGAVRAFFNRPAVALTDGLHPIGRVLDVDAVTFERRLLDPAADEDAFEQLADLLRSLRDRSRGTEVSRAVAVARRLGDPELRSVAVLAAQSGLGVRALQRMFREHVGAAPKALLRRARLQEAALRIESGDATSLAGLAAQLGYTDQAHFTRDFRVAVGKTPRQLEASLRD